MNIFIISGKRINFGTTAIDLSAVEQLADEGQTRAVAELIHLYSGRHLSAYEGLRDSVEAMMRDIDNKGLDYATRTRTDNLALPRSFEVSAAINRMRTLEIESED